jgi:hypothetical protein
MSLSISKVENFFKRKSRNQWLNLVDQNNALFHKIVKVRNSKNLMKHLWDKEGERRFKRLQRSSTENC